MKATSDAQTPQKTLPPVIETHDDELSPQFKIVMCEGIIGFFCSCGNMELITEENYYYQRFRSHPHVNGPNGMPMVYCLQCGSVGHEPLFFKKRPKE